VSERQVSAIAVQNDEFRRGCGMASRLQGERVHTPGIEALGLEAVLDIWARVRAFATFTEDNDPYGEHDFGCFEHALAGKVFWKIDYYDLKLEFASNDPLDLSQTRRVLTVMLAAEY
jgi:hypothetical protein